MPDLIEGTGPNPDYGTHHSLSSEPLGERRQRLRAEQLEAELERLRAGIGAVVDYTETAPSTLGGCRVRLLRLLERPDA